MKISMAMLAIVKNVEKAMEKTPGSPYVSPHLSRKQAEVLVDYIRNSQRVKKQAVINR